MPSLRRALLALTCLLALVATGCRVSTEPVLEANDRPADIAVDAPASNPTPSAPDEPDPASPTPTVAAGGTVADPSLALERPPEPDLPAAWSEPLTLDPAVTAGELSNGLRYLIRKNTAPGGQAQLRLVVQAGSVNERDGRYGVAHFLEHMMFNGTERFPGNELVQVLEGFGSGFGPDINAYTSYEETVYELTVPAPAEESLQLGLDVLREWAGRATLIEQAVQTERGVVREELRRSAESVNGRLSEEVLGVLLDGTDLVGRSPIGLEDVITSMSSEDLRDFYDRWYRPELMTVIAVGDFEPSSMEARIADSFGELVASVERVEPLELDYGTGPLPAATFDVFTDAELNRVDIDLFWRVDAGPQLTAADARADVIRNLALNMVNDRLFESVEGGQGVFLGARASLNAFTSRHQVMGISGTTAAENVGDGLVELLVVLEQARQYGFSQDEFDRAVSETRASVDQGYAGRSTRQDARYAGGLVQYALTGAPILSADTEVELFGELLDSIEPEDVRRFLFEFLDSNPYVLVAAPEADAAAIPEPEDLADLYGDTVGSAVAPRQVVTVDSTELLVAPEPAAVIDERRIDPLSATVVTYENGVRMAYRNTTIVDNLIQMRATSLGGFFAVEGAQVPLLGRASEMIAGSGFASADNVTLDRLLTGRVVSLGASVSRATEEIEGDASPEDLETLFQLIHLQMTEPAIGDVQVRQFEDRYRPLAANPDATPVVAANLELWRLRYGDSPYFRLIPNESDLDALDPEALLDVWSGRFANAADFDFVFVGDIDPDVLVDLGARYLGTLPATDEREDAVDRDPGLPEENLVATVAAGIGEQGFLRINWESPYPYTLEDEIAAEALEIVVNARLRDLIREQLGASYSPSAAVSILREPKAWVDTIIEVETDPARIDEVAAAVRGELDRIRSGDFDQVYLDRALDQMVQDYTFFSNADWLELVQRHLRYPERDAAEFTRRADVARGLSIGDLAAAAGTVFPSTRSVEVRLIPAGG